MIINKKLKIFEYFEIDSSLQKFQKVDKGSTIDDIQFSDESISISSPPTSDNVNTQIDYMNYLNQQHIGPIAKFKIYLFKWMFKDYFDTSISDKKLNADKVLDFFKKIKTNISELSYDEGTIENYIKILENAQKTGQVALVETLIRKKDILLLESTLIKGGFKTYITEDLVVKFFSKFKIYNNKQLKMSWIKNFNRIIPDDVIKSKEKADKLKVFDNYVVLHYDKNDDQTKLTKTEVAKLKDPILFGVIKNSTRLYFIGDWEDEYCDLTLNKLLEKMTIKTIPTLEDMKNLTQD